MLLSVITFAMIPCIDDLFTSNFGSKLDKFSFWRCLKQGMRCRLKSGLVHSWRLSIKARYRCSSFFSFWIKCLSSPSGSIMLSVRQQNNCDMLWTSMAGGLWIVARRVLSEQPGQSSGIPSVHKLNLYVCLLELQVQGTFWPQAALPMKAQSTWRIWW